jgi:DNA-binding transcriptional LysR family regulator
MSFTAALRDLNKLNTFVRVAQRRSFTQAAAELRTKPSVVSKRMKELEDALGFRLLNRSTHGLVLTDAGEGLFRHCLQLLARLDTYVVERRDLETGPFGTLHVQATSDVAGCVLAPLLVAFVRDHPGVRVQLAEVPDGTTAAGDGIDVIVSTRKPTVPGLIGHDLGTVRHVICAAPAYFEKFGRPRTPADLAAHNCLVNPSSGQKGWPFQGARPQLVAVKGALAATGNAVLIAMALAGSGIIRVPHDAVRDALADKRLEAIFAKSALSPERLAAYVAKSKHLPAKTADFVTFLTTALGRGNGQPPRSTASRTSDGVAP